jgi:hypothetical protein
MSASAPNHREVNPRGIRRADHKKQSGALSKASKARSKRLAEPSPVATTSSKRARRSRIRPTPSGARARRKPKLRPRAGAKAAEERQKKNQ